MITYDFLLETLRERERDTERWVTARRQASIAGALRGRRTAVKREPPERVLARIDETWSALWPRLNGLDDAALVRPGASGGWSARDVLLHLARWHEAAGVAIRARVDGRRPAHDYSDYEAWNARWHEEDRDVAPSHARARAAVSYLDLRALLAGLPPERWDAFVHSWVRGSNWEHYREHLEPLDSESRV
jgi:hypothetical protein